MTERTSESTGIDWAHVDRSIVVLGTTAAGAFFLVLLTGWLFSGDPELLKQTVAPISVGGTGLIMLAMGKPRPLLQLFVGGAGLIAFVSIGGQDVPGNPLIGLLIMTIVGFVLTHEHVVVTAVIGSGVLAITGYAWHLPGTVDSDRAVMAFSLVASFLFTAWLIHYLKTQSERSRERLEDLLATKNEFVATVSHELRTPLTTVVALAHEFNDRLGDFTTEELNELSAMLVNESSDLAAIVDDLLVAARPETGELAMDHRVVDIRQVVSSVAQNQANVVVDFRPASLVHVLADELRLRQIVRNLLSNAARYGGEQVRLVVTADGASVNLEVRDNGAAVPHGERTRMFDAYHGVNGSDGRPGSVGIGLTVSRRLSRMMGGELTYRHDGTESIFAVRFPQVSSPEPSQATAAA